MQIGDKVKVINYPALAIGAKDYYMKEATITNISPWIWGNGMSGAYFLDVDDGWYAWREDWLQPVESIPEIIETEFINCFGE